MLGVNSYYERNFSNYGMPAGRADAILKLIGKIKNQKVLDIGCGEGRFISRFINQGNECFGVDISKRALKLAAKRGIKVLNIDISANKLPYKNNTFDLIVFSEVIEHLFNPEEVLREIFRVLKKDGILIVTTPNFLYWGNRIRFLLGKFHYDLTGVFDRGHVHFYSYSNLMSDLNNARFKIIAENHIYPGTTLINIFKKVFPGLFSYQFVIKCTK